MFSSKTKCCKLNSLYYFYTLSFLQTNGSVNVQIDLDQSLQSEPRLRLLLAENLLRDTNAVIQRLEVSDFVENDLAWLIAYPCVRMNKCACTFLIDSLIIP